MYFSNLHKFTGQFECVEAAAPPIAERFNQPPGRQVAKATQRTAAHAENGRKSLNALRRPSVYVDHLSPACALKLSTEAIDSFGTLLLTCHVAKALVMQLQHVRRERRQVVMTHAQTRQCEASELQTACLS